MIFQHGFVLDMLQRSRLVCLFKMYRKWFGYLLAHQTYLGTFVNRVCCNNKCNRFAF